MSNELYTLFTHERLECVQWSFKKSKIDSFIELWNDGIKSKDISKQLRIREIEVLLIAVELGALGKIKQREKGFFG